MTRVHFLVIGAIATSAAVAAAQNQQAPILEVDHVFVLTAPMATEERAPWLRPGTSILTVRDGPASPMLFIVPRYVALDAWVAKARESEPESFKHKTGVERLTRVTLAGPYQPPPGAIAKIAELTFVNSPDHGLELTFDAGRQGKRADLRPTLPLVLVF